ncbi:putative membrane protein yjeI [Serratia fonticola AU-P3(3)]|jgi:ABC-type glycerol-3-phosphate transport system substrate-binding protein|nr:putative membrane protein yjeI [Serratia fonticola AU-P3(3)]
MATLSDKLLRNSQHHMGNKMRIKALLGLSAAVLLAGCSSTNELTAAGQQVKFTDTKPAAECQLVGEVTGTQSNWLSGSGGEGSSMRGAANDLRNKAAAMGGNVIYGATSPSQNLLSSFAPLDSKMIGQVYKCP